MSVTATCESVSQKRTLASLLAGRAPKRPKREDGQRLHQAALQLLEQHQDLSGLFRELETPETCLVICESEIQKLTVTAGVCSSLAGSLLVSELRRQAAQMGVSVAVLSVKMVLERLTEVTFDSGEQKQKGNRSMEMLAPGQRDQLCALLKSSKELMSQRALCPKLLWQEYRRVQNIPKLEVVYYLHLYNILTLKYILESDEGAHQWLVSQLKNLCERTPSQEENEEARLLKQKVISTVVGVLVGTGFGQIQDVAAAAAAADRKLPLLCRSVLDDLLFWTLDVVDKSSTPECVKAGARLWIGIYDSSLCGVSASEEAVQRFFTHSLTQTLTYKPQLTVSDAISLQNEWTFAKACCLLTTLFRKLALIFSTEQLLRHLQQVLETHEVNWKHVLCFLSTLLVYCQSAQLNLRELLSRLLNSAFEGYDLENMITAFLLARQASLEGPAIFPSYGDWFKTSFGSGSGYHANSKKSLVFLLKFLSDLVPFEPPQYLKVHILSPPYVPAKHRGLLMEYVTLAKTRLADLKESLEDMGLYESASGAGASAAVQPECQDVEKAVSLFEVTGKISATVMEASIFRRPYFLTRFLPALLKPRLLPAKPDARMSFIEALNKAEKIPSAQYSSYVESCQKLRHRSKNTAWSDAKEDPLEVLKTQLRSFVEMLTGGNDGDMSAQLSRISHSLSVIFGGRPDEQIGHKVITLNTEVLRLPELHLNAVSMILRTFCQCLLNTSKSRPPNKRSLWASGIVSLLLRNTQILCALVHRLWDLLHNQRLSLSSAHVLGLAAFVVHLHTHVPQDCLVKLEPSTRHEPMSFDEFLNSALVCSTSSEMLFCVRFCVAAACYGISVRDSQFEQQQQNHIPSSIYKKLLYLLPRLIPETRGSPADGSANECEEERECALWSSITDRNTMWRKTAWHLWKHDGFQRLRLLPQYQFSFSEWLDNEIRVQRSEDGLSDPERQEYQQWACMDLYLTLPEEQGGCGGNMKSLCSHLLGAATGQRLSGVSGLEGVYRQSGTSRAGTCLPDLLCRLQELIYEMGVLRGHKHAQCDFLFEYLSQICSPTSSSVRSVSAELGLQHSVHLWNRVLPFLPAVLFVKVKSEAGRTTLDCDKLMEHINQHQRLACSPADFLPSHITLHFLKGLFYACVECNNPQEQFNKIWSQISVQCPLLLVSAVHLWPRLSATMFSLWRRLSNEESPPQQLQLLTDCQLWANSFLKGQQLPIPPAAALTLAASVHRSLLSREAANLRAALRSLQDEKEEKHKQVLIFLLFLSVKEHLSAILDPQAASRRKIKHLCSELLTVLVSSADWLLVFTPAETGVNRPMVMIASDKVTQMMPWAFCSLLIDQNVELLQRAARCTGFLHTAVTCYVSAQQLYLEGQTPAAEVSKQQVEPSHILSGTKQFLLRLIRQASPAALSSSQIRQLVSRCADQDPELSAALSTHLDPHDLSPEMDFL